MEEAFYLLEIISSEFIWKFKRFRRHPNCWSAFRLSLSGSSKNRGAILIAGAFLVRAFLLDRAHFVSALISGFLQVVAYPIKTFELI